MGVKFYGVKIRLGMGKGMANYPNTQIRAKPLAFNTIIFNLRYVSSKIIIDASRVVSTIRFIAKKFCWRAISKSAAL